MAVNKFITKATPRMSPTEAAPFLRKTDGLKENQGRSTRDSSEEGMVSMSEI